MLQSAFLPLSLYVAGLVAMLVPYLPFSPMTIDLLNLRRERQLAIYRRRRWYWSAGSLCFGVLAVLLLADPGSSAMLPWWFLVGSVGVLGLFYWTGYVPFVMSPPAASRVLDAYGACDFAAPEAVVLGLDTAGESRAYLRDQIARPHYFRDVVGGKPITITYCILCNSAMAFESTLDGRVLHLRCVTAYNNNIVFEDAVAGNFIQQLDGRVVDGPDCGRSLPMLPMAITTWREWVRLHPHTTLFFAPSVAVRDRLVDRMLAWMIPISRLAARARPWHRIRGALDSRLPAMASVLGVELGAEQCAFPISALVRQPVVNAALGGMPIAVLYDVERDIAQVYSRQLDDRTLIFEAGDGGHPGRDTATGSTWNAAGVAVDGPLAGRRLAAMPHVNKLFWFSWALFKPGTRVWSPEQAAPTPASLPHRPTQNLARGANP